MRTPRTFTVSKFAGFLFDLREMSPTIAKEVDRLAKKHGVAALGDRYARGVVVVGASGLRYDGHELGVRMVEQAATASEETSVIGSVIGVVSL